MPETNQFSNRSSKSTGMEWVIGAALFFPLAYNAAGNLVNMIGKVQNFGAEMGARLAQHGPAIAHMADMAIKAWMQ